MSWSLQIQNGDLSLNGGSYGTVSGSQKLAQDLKCALLERMGTDDAHPNFGSLIDGGVANGVEQPSLIATTDWTHAIALIESEIRRIINQYQASQVRRSENDRMTYGKPTLTPDELLVAISSIQFFQVQDALVVKVGIQTGANNTININLPLGA